LLKLALTKNWEKQTQYFSGAMGLTQNPEENNHLLSE